MGAGRRAQGEGTVYFDDSVHAWVGQGSAGVNPVSGKRRRIRVSAPTKREAHARLRERLLELERTAGAAAPGTVGQLLDLWLNREAPKTMSLRTRKSVKSMVDKHLMPSMAQVKVGELRVEHFEDLLNAKRAEGLARSSLVKLHSYLGQAFDAGVRRRLVGWNPARVAVVPQALSRREGRALTTADARALLYAAERHRLGVGRGRIDYGPEDG
jgi:integrase